MDLRMPIMDGFEASRQIKETKNGGHIRIIAITASILELDKNKLAMNGISGYIRKPLKEQELFFMLEDKLGKIFTYSDQTSTKKTQAEFDGINLTHESMTVIPQDLIDQMNTATTNAQFDKLMDLIDSASTFSPQIAKKLRNLANDFNYDILLTLFKKA
jgi:CheY-like chemotaxis protein